MVKSDFDYCDYCDVVTKALYNDTTRVSSLNQNPIYTITEIIKLVPNMNRKTAIRHIYSLREKFIIKMLVVDAPTEDELEEALSAGIEYKKKEDSFFKNNTPINREYIAFDIGLLASGHLKRYFMFNPMFSEYAESLKTSTS